MYKITPNQRLKRNYCAPSLVFVSNEVNIIDLEISATTGHKGIELSLQTLIGVTRSYIEERTRGVYVLATTQTSCIRPSPWYHLISYDIISFVVCHMMSYDIISLLFVSAPLFCLTSCDITFFNLFISRCGRRRLRQPLRLLCLWIATKSETDSQTCCPFCLL